MKFARALETTAVFILAFAVVASAAPKLLSTKAADGPPIPYVFDYSIRDEINAVMSARVEEGDDKGVVRGSFTYIRPDGVIQTTSYVADANGFRSETVEEPAGGQEIPNPDGNIEVTVNLPHSDPLTYQYTAQEYKELHQ